MPIGQLITLGIGTPSSISILDLTGLYPSSFSPGGGGGGTPSPSPGVPTDLSGNVVYALPARVCNIGWFASGAAILECSNDGTNWSTVDSLSGAGYSSVIVSAVFIRPSAQVTVIIRKKKAKL